MGEYQEEVLINILDLQAELRGDEPEQQAAVDPTVQEALAVTDGGLTVSVPSPADEEAAFDRLAALDDRLGRLESHLAAMKERIARIDPAPGFHATSSPDNDDEAGSGSFLDLQKIVAERLDSR